MSDYPMLISNKLHSFRNFLPQIYIIFLSTHDFRSEKDPVNQLFSLFFYSLKSITT